MAVADGFHVDINGNLWLGSNRETFDATTRSEAPFYVYANGDLVANSGTFAGNLSAAGGTFAGDLSAAGGTFNGDISAASGTFTGNLSGSSISGGSININNNFIVDSSGNLTANNATLNGYLTSGSSISGDQITGGTIQGTTINAGNLTVTGQFQFGDVSISSNDIVTTIQNNALNGSKLVDGSVSNAKIGNLSAGNITSGTLALGLNSFDSGGVSLVGTVNISPSVSGSIIGNSNNSLAGNSLTVYGGATIQGTIQADTFRDRNSTSNIDMASYIDINPSNSLKMRLYTSNIYTYDDFLCSPSGGYNLGNSSFRWNTVYATNGTINTSDITQKTDVVPATLGLDFVNTLEPIEFKWIDRGDGTEGIRTHLGFSAQDIKQKLIDYKGEDQNYGVYTQGSYETQYVIDEETGEQIEVDDSDKQENFGLRMTEMIPMLTKAVQELSTQISDLTARVEALEG